MLTPTHLTTLRALAVPGDLWPDVLAGWDGPIQWQLNDGPWRRGVWGPIGASSEPERRGVVRAGDMRPDPIVRLPFDRREVRAHVGHLMSAGLRCDECYHRGEVRTKPVGPVPSVKPCPACHGTGYLRRPAPAWHLLPPGESATPLPSELAADAPALLACHVARVAVCGVGVANALSGWTRTSHADGIRRVPVVGKSKLMAWVGDKPATICGKSFGWALIDTAVGWPDAPGWLVASGPETGPAGMAAADAAALAAGFALVTADGIVLPWPNAAEVDRG